ncbi:unnamed protein product [Cyprideis torosa]|uniref:Phosphoserine phosphatase n=1 Tax=Cyprideis torosa TaxID=163714 RepID=A0A7R8WTA6_9CRUS|nr:unnamed protein product [Cyprideis torosa]CAG0905527.1 unnamed protein product [Cyprideis torosa]
MVNSQFTSHQSGVVVETRRGGKLERFDDKSEKIIAEEESPTQESEEERVKRIWRSADAVCFDVDSTVCPTEAIDELAAFCGKANIVAQVTSQAMGGALDFRDALRLRLNLIKPSLKDVNDFMRLKPPALSPGVKELVQLLHSRKVAVYLVSGGFTSIIKLVATELGISHDRIFANKLMFYQDGTYAGFDEKCPTSAQGGKTRVVQELKDEYGYKTIVSVGDGWTDLETCPPADAFIGFGGCVVREKVRAEAGWFVHSFQELIDEFQRK